MQNYGIKWVWRQAGEGVVRPGVSVAQPNPFMASLLIMDLLYGLRTGGRYSRNTAGYGKAAITITSGRCLSWEKDSPLRALLYRSALAGKDPTLDFQATEYVGGTFLGPLLILQKQQHWHGRKLLHHPRFQAAENFHMRKKAR